MLPCKVHLRVLEGSACHFPFHKKMLVARLKLSQCIQSALKLLKLKDGLPLPLLTQKVSQLLYELQCGSENTDIMPLNAFHLSAEHKQLYNAVLQ